MKRSKSKNEERLLNAIRILRDVTIVIKIFPFVLSLLYITFYVIQLAFRDEWTYQVEEFLYTSPITVILLLVMSYILRLCKWHRIQCMLLLMPQFFSHIDMHVYEHGVRSAVIADIAILCILTLSVLNSYMMFFRNS